ncbi:alpha/beta hydrolase [Phototrophicus methaneseepsis]|uniref:Alpha/beta hydrolase n=1 Tax=Phototrophicus methaneseepsis TaxID=2710758 RepID=A0A7S8IEA0_9CHLR|nr:alpha/beta hydrolase [Phototrophicus methaneseepsis]QPC81613.1 alpha/beta hydrolase [Phototrophicus methaneseepsis]
MLRRIFASILSFFSFMVGLIIALPPMSFRQWAPQMAASEAGWVAAIAGAMGLALKPNRRRTIVLAGLGIWLTMRPYRQFWRGFRENDEAMRIGLGVRYLDEIAPDVRPYLQSEPLSITRLPSLSLNMTQAEIIPDVVFRETETRILKLDVYRPKTAPLRETGYPAIITIHGGSWRSGNKGQYFNNMYQRLTEQGYAFFDIQYRFSQEAHWPAQYEDVAAALEWVVEHAEEYGVDASRIALLGRSAGGFLALHAAYRAAPELGIKAVVAYYSPIDLRLWPLDPGSVGVQLMGGLPHEMPERYSDAAVTSHLHESCPPTMLIHGRKDSVVPILHSQVLREALDDVHVPSVLLSVPWGQHGFDGILGGPGAQMTDYHLERFLAWALYKDD